MTKLSRSKIDLFIECPRCFWLDVKQGIKRPPPPPYTINSAIDYLLKQEFDIYRGKGTPHPIMVKNNIDAIPYKHEKMNEWRHNFTGVRYHHKPTDFLVTGAVDDVWVNPKGELIVVDYKSTGANQHKIHDSYKRQMDIYQWLLRQNGFDVSKTGYFVFARVSKAGGFRSARLEPGEGGGEAVLAFDIFVEPLEGDDSWVAASLKDARETYDQDKPPKPSPVCEYCRYRGAAAGF